MPTPMEEFKATLRAAKWVSTPVIVIRTTDPTATTHLIAHELFVPPAVAEKETYPTLRWDIVQGYKAINNEAKTLATKLDPGNSFGGQKEPRDALAALQEQSVKNELCEGAIVCFANAHRYWNDADVVQALYNLRDCFPEFNQTLILLTIPGAKVPPELSEHVTLLDEPLPTREDLGKVLDDVVADAQTRNQFPTPSPEDRANGTDALLGLTIFAAQQAAAMSLTQEGLNLPRLWARKVQIIESTPGLSVWKGDESFDTLAGVDNVKGYLEIVMGCQHPPGGIMFLDEFEKQLAGAGTDLSGVKTEMVGTLLTWLHDKNAKGLIFIGVSGTAKSATAKAAGHLLRKPTISFDFGGMQASRVGESGERLRNSLRVVEAVTDSNPLVIVTCNSLRSLPPELHRRFTEGIFFFDMPDAEARQQIWKLYLSKFKLTGDLPDDTDWTGANIENCCRKAFNYQKSLQWAAQYIVPTGISARDEIRQLRTQSSGKYIDAAKPGPYIFDDSDTKIVTSRRTRSITKLG